MPHVDTPQSLCRFGLARGDITPPVGIYHRMWGAATHERATGVHRPLTATAMVFQAAEGPPTPQTEQVVVAVDLCLLWAKEMNDLLRAVSNETGVAREQIAVTFSHTHAAGLMGLERQTLPGGELIPPFLDAVGVKIASLVREARASAEPAVIAYGGGRCSLAAQRDFWDEASGQFVCGFNPAAPADDTVLVARVTSPDGAPRASIVNYACHPTTLAWQNTLISPDFPGAMRELVEQEMGVPCVFIQGASGDLGPREGLVGDTKVADRNGRQLGHAVLAALAALPPPLTRFRYSGPVISGATLGAWAHEPLSAADQQRRMRWQLQRWTVELPYRTDLPGREQTLRDRDHWFKRQLEAQGTSDLQKVRDCSAMVERLNRRLTRLQNLPDGPAFPMPVTLWRMGDALWIMVENELYQHFQLELRRRFREYPLVIATLTNGSRASYLPTHGAYGKGIYQESVAVLAPGCLEQLVDSIAMHLPETP